MRALMLVLLVGCADETVIAPLPDASVQPLTVDACVREPSGDCCALLPDEDAVRSCVVAAANPGDCGVAVCWRADCSSVRLNFCAP